MTPSDLVKNFGDLAADQRRQAIDTRSRISGWVLAGHGGGLLVLLNALSNGANVSFSSVLPSAICLVFGLLLVVIGVRISADGSELSAQRLTRIHAYSQRLAICVSEMDRIGRILERNGPSEAEVKAFNDNKAEAEKAHAMIERDSAPSKKEQIFSKLGALAIDVSGVLFAAALCWGIFISVPNSIGLG